MRKPSDLKIGDRITVKGFQFEHRAAVGNKKDHAITRHATLTRILRCGYELKFDKGYTEHWHPRNLLYALNGLDVPTVYAPCHMAPEQYIHFQMTGGREGWKEEL